MKNRTINPSIKRAVCIRDKFICQSCGEVGNFLPDAARVLGQEKKAANWDCTRYYRIPMEFDHIVPFSKGGKTEVDNLQLLCHKCNRKKGDKI